ncbi:type II toxin-antitoxin system RelE/ParE family toxin [Paenibacillus crassostreae]|uniref:Addiction module toxin RelE n=1 Tax=Paenibacillus crassostreae TaxID=1763538 RepID=A0A167EIQ7_9BACL|nr:type II toxin-antitoxin system RelE/ParE family toxin [Paenibacillus crassostreae]AOZ94900.1 hypothetical protein LPB68_21815 [Paenibacillus crassostreae]OAB75583.1 hypothetical protein PNBC_08105 [Paenibacillus crassostreae]
MLPLLLDKFFYVLYKIVYMLGAGEMDNHRIQQYPKIVLSNEAFNSAIQDYDVCSNTRRKIFEVIGLLNAHGTNKTYLGKKIENTKRSNLWELKIKGASKTEWRFLFKRISGSDEYALLHFFLKKDEKIRDRDFATAERIAVREGW